jgi:predicted dehydrogenase
MKRVRVGVVGVGHLGKEHARILASLPQADLVGVVDVNADQANAVATRFNTRAFTDFRQLIPLVDAASIVVPTTHHAAVAREFLTRGIPVLVEKPLARNSMEARELVDLAHSNNSVLQVGHIERFNSAFENLMTRPFRPRWIRSQRIGPFTGRSPDVGVVLDLMIHDLDLLLHFTQSSVRSVEAIGMSWYGSHEDVANARLTFTNGCVADVTASRASPTAIRMMQAWGSEGYAEIDFAARKLTLVQASESVRRQGLDPARLDPVSRAHFRDDLFTRYLEVETIDGKASDQLTCELQELLEAAATGRTPRVTGEHALAAIEVAERILHSLRSHAWDGTLGGYTGPLQMPPASGLLFPHPGKRDAA